MKVVVLFEGLGNGWCWQIIYIFISIDEKLWEKFKEYQYDGFRIYSFYDDMKLLELDSTLNHVQSLESHTYC